MNYTEICKLVKYSEKETNLFMPNEIFEELGERIDSAVHISFAYSYVYLITWIYRYAKNVTTRNIITNPTLKEILQYNPKNQTVNYLIKKNGLLDQMEYTETTRDFPIGWSYSKENDDGLEFHLSSDNIDIVEKLPAVANNFTIKKPLKAFYRILVEEDVEYETPGTFYDVSNTHNIPFEVFLYCMNNKEIGCTGFYLYSYLKHMNDIFSGGYDVPLTRLSQETSLPDSTLNRYMSVMKQYKMLDFIHNQDYFIPGLEKELRKANTYIARDYDIFNNSPVKVKKMGFMKMEKYIEMKESEVITKDEISLISFD